MLRLISFPLIRRIHSRTVFAAWGAYVDPGFTGELELVPVSTTAPRETAAYDAREDGSEPKDYLLPDGAWMANVVGAIESSPDGRYVAARRDLRGSSFLLYDKLEHVRYVYEADDAPDVFVKLFRVGSASLAAVLNQAERIALQHSRGMWLEEDELPEPRKRVIKKALAPNLTLTATLIGPEDLRCVVNPYELLFEEARRLSLNGFATPFLCQDLEHAKASPDGKSLVVKGCIVEEQFAFERNCWYYRGPDGVWVTIDAAVFDDSHYSVGQLESVAQWSATDIVFAIRGVKGNVGSGWIQTATQALPFRVSVTHAGNVASCQVPIQKLA